MTPPQSVRSRPMGREKRSHVRLAYLLLLQGAVVGLGFLFTIVATRLVGMGGYGEIAYAMAIGNILAAVVRYGTDETLIVSMIRAENKPLELEAASAVRTLILLVTVLPMLALSLTGLISLKEALAATAFLLISMQVAGQYDYFDEQHKHTYALIINKVVQLAGFAAIAMFLSSDALTVFIISSFAANLALLAVQYRYFRHRFPREQSHNGWPEIAARARTIFSTNHVVMFGSVMSLGLYSANQIYIKNALSFQDLAIFAVQWQVCNMLMIYMKQVSRIYKPILVRHKMSDGAGYNAAAFGFFAIMCVPPTILSVLIWLNYDLIFPRLFTEQMAGHADMFLLLTVFVFLRGIYYTLSQLSFVDSKNDVSFYSNAAGAAVIVGVIVVLKGYTRLSDGVIAMNIAMLAMIVVAAAMMKVRGGAPPRRA